MRGWKLRTGMKQEIMMKISASINTKFKKKNATIQTSRGDIQQNPNPKTFLTYNVISIMRETKFHQHPTPKHL